MPHDTSVDPPASWKSYFERGEDALASIRVDVNADTPAHVSERPWLVCVRIAMRTPRSDGLSSSDESAILWKIEDALERTLKEMLDAQLVGTLTRDGRRELAFYASSVDALDVCVETVLALFAGYSADATSRRDANWEYFREELAPGPEDWRAISDGDVLLTLKRNGDRPEIERAVRHYAYFPTTELRDAFWAAFGTRGYRRVEIEERVEGPHGLAFESWQTVEWTAIHARTLALFRGAKEYGGDYDGWVTSVERGE